MGCFLLQQTYCLQRDRTIMSDMLRGQAKMMDYDAICTFVFKDYKDFAKFMFVSFHLYFGEDAGRADGCDMAGTTLLRKH
jgi:hypothetical protein